MRGSFEEAPTLHEDAQNKKVFQGLRRSGEVEFWRRETIDIRRDPLERAVLSREREAAIEWRGAAIGLKPIRFLFLVPVVQDAFEDVIVSGFSDGVQVGADFCRVLERAQADVVGPLLIEDRLDAPPTPRMSGVKSITADRHNIVWGCVFVKPGLNL
jgi:hypothetical protein